MNQHRNILVSFYRRDNDWPYERWKEIKRTRPHVGDTYVVDDKVVFKIEGRTFVSGLREVLDDSRPPCVEVNTTEHKLRRENRRLKKRLAVLAAHVRTPPLSEIERALFAAAIKQVPAPFRTPWKQTKLRRHAVWRGMAEYVQRKFKMRV